MIFNKYFKGFPLGSRVEIMEYKYEIKIPKGYVFQTGNRTMQGSSKSQPMKWKPRIHRGFWRKE